MVKQKPANKTGASKKCSVASYIEGKAVLLQLRQLLLERKKDENFSGNVLECEVGYFVRHVQHMCQIRSDDVALQEAFGGRQEAEL